MDLLEELFKDVSKPDPFTDGRLVFGCRDIRVLVQSRGRNWKWIQLKATVHLHIGRTLFGNCAEREGETRENRRKYRPIRLRLSEHFKSFVSNYRL